MYKMAPKTTSPDYKCSWFSTNFTIGPFYIIPYECHILLVNSEQHMDIRNKCYLGTKTVISLIREHKIFQFLASVFGSLYWISGLTWSDLILNVISINMIYIEQLFYRSHTVREYITNAFILKLQQVHIILKHA